MIQHSVGYVCVAVTDAVFITSGGSVRVYDTSFTVTGERAEQLRSVIEFLGFKPRKSSGDSLRLTDADGCKLIEELIHEGISSLYGYARMDKEGPQ